MEKRNNLDGVAFLPPSPSSHNFLSEADHDQSSVALTPPHSAVSYDDSIEDGSNNSGGSEATKTNRSDVRSLHHIAS